MYGYVRMCTYICICEILAFCQLLEKFKINDANVLLPHYHVLHDAAALTKRASVAHTPPLHCTPHWASASALERRLLLALHTLTLHFLSCGTGCASWLSAYQFVGASICPTARASLHFCTVNAHNRFRFAASSSSSLSWS